MLNRILEIYARCGKSLQSIGISEAVIPITETFYVLELFQQSKIVIIGGDLYKKKPQTQFEHTFDSWFYNGDNVQESIDEAVSYLNNFKMQEIYVSLIIKN